MKKHLNKVAVMSFILMVSLLFFVSCATSTDSRSLTGVWTSKSDDTSSRFSFTSDGFYAYEEFSEDGLTFLDFGRYEAQVPEEDSENEEEPILSITLDSYSTEYTWDGNNLVIDLWGNKTVFTRSSKIARNNSNRSNLLGVWSFDGGTIGFTTGGFAIAMTRGGDLGSYSVEAADAENGLPSILIDEQRIPFIIINSRLFMDDSGFAGTWNKISLNRETKTGEDQTSRDVLVNASPWHLTDVSSGTSHYIYSFSSGGGYTMEHYTDYDDSKSNSSGTFKYDNHHITLSDDSDLAYAIIDLKPFMFSI